MVEGGSHSRHYRPGERTSAAGQPGGTGNNRLLPDNQPGSSPDGVGPQGSDSTAGEQAAALWVTAAESAAGRPGTGGGGSSNWNRAVAHKCPGVRRADRKHSPTRGTGNPGRSATARGGSRGESGGRGDPTWADHVHGWVTAGRWGYRVCSGLEEGGVLGGRQNAHGTQPGGIRRGVRRHYAGIGVGF